MMDVLTSETCWAVNWHNKASVIKLVYLYSNSCINIMLVSVRVQSTLMRIYFALCMGADKSLARSGRKEANVSVRMAWISFGALPCSGCVCVCVCVCGGGGGGGIWWQLASRCCWNRARPWYASELVSFLVGLRTYQHSGIVWGFQQSMQVTRVSLIGCTVEFLWAVAEVQSPRHTELLIACIDNVVTSELFLSAFMLIQGQ